MEPVSARIRDSLLELKIGDITLEETEAIASAANSALAGGGGVDGAIHRAAGPGVMEELRRRYQGCPTGSAVITGAGRLKAKYILHAVGPRYRGDPEDAKLLAGAYQGCLDLCAAHRINSISFPSVSTGVYAYPPAEAAPVALSTVELHLSRSPFPRLACFVLFDEETFLAYAKAFASLGLVPGVDRA